MKSPRKRLTDRLDKLCREIVLIRDENKCQWCGRYVEKTNAHCSHVIPKSKGNALRWDLINLKLLCFHCHINVWHKSPILAMDWLQSFFPARYVYLMKHKEDIRKFSIDDLKELEQELKQKLKDLKDES